MTPNKKIFPMAGIPARPVRRALNVQPEQMRYCPPEADVEDNVCSLIVFTPIIKDAYCVSAS